jgi:hypothetical protein
VGESSPEQLGSLQLDGAQLPIFDLAAFNAADIDRVKSFSTSFGGWQLPTEVAAALALPAGSRAALTWIHDTGNAYELFKAVVMPEGTRVALLAHVRHRARVHELLWGWRRHHDDADGWAWLVERLARLEAGDNDDHLG